MIDHRTDSRYQGGPRIAPQTILKQARNLGISVRYMRLTFSLSESLDHFSQVAETEVDRLQLEQVLLAHDLLFVNLLAASQVTQVKFAAS